MKHPLRIAIALLLVVCATAGAGTYRLDTGRGVAVCEAYAKSLAVVTPAIDLGVFMHPITIRDPQSELRMPEWQGRYDQPMPVPVGIDLNSKVNDFIWERGVNPAAFVPASDWPQWRGSPDQLKEARETFDIMREQMFSSPGNRDSYALLDIDNDGAAEPVSADNQDVGYSAFGALLLVLASDLSDIDRVKTNRLLFYPPRASDAPVFRPLQADDPEMEANGKPLDYTVTEDAMRYSRYDVLLYRGKTYISAWGFDVAGSGEDRMTIHIYFLDHKRRRELCTYRIAS